MQSSHHKSLLSHHSCLQSFHVDMLGWEDLVCGRYRVQEDYYYIRLHELRQKLVSQAMFE